MNSGQGAQIQLESYKQDIEKPILPSSLAFITDLATDIPRFKSTQVLSRAVHRTMYLLSAHHSGIAQQTLMKLV